MVSKEIIGSQKTGCKKREVELWKKVEGKGNGSKGGRKRSEWGKILYLHCSTVWVPH